MAYRRTERTEARLVGNRERILRAARTLVAEGGFREAQVAAIATLAKVATGTVYRYFPSKTDLLAELLHAICLREVSVAAQVAESGGPAIDRLADAVRVFTNRAVRGRRLAYAVIVEPVDPEVDRVRLQYRRALAEVFETILRGGIAQNEFPEQDVQANAACLVGACLEGLVARISPDAIDGEAEDRDRVERIVAFCVRAVSGTVVSGEKTSTASEVGVRPTLQVLRRPLTT